MSLGRLRRPAATPSRPPRPGLDDGRLVEDRSREVTRAPPPRSPPRKARRGERSGRLVARSRASHVASTMTRPRFSPSSADAMSSRGDDVERTRAGPGRPRGSGCSGNGPRRTPRPRSLHGFVGPQAEGRHPGEIKGDGLRLTGRTRQRGRRLSAGSPRPDSRTCRRGRRRHRRDRLLPLEGETRRSLPESASPRTRRVSSSRPGLAVFSPSKAPQPRASRGAGMEPVTSVWSLKGKFMAAIIPLLGEPAAPKPEPSSGPARPRGPGASTDPTGGSGRAPPSSRPRARG